MNSILSEQSVGYQGIIQNLSGADVYVSRLRELGFIRGEKVTLVQTTPFGDPLIVSVRGTRVALRKEEAQCILV